MHGVFYHAGQPAHPPLVRIHEKDGVAVFQIFVARGISANGMHGDYDRIIIFTA